MTLRPLADKDAPLMLEWMHDPNVVSNLKANFQKKTMDDCTKFISAAQDTRRDVHFAIADEQDEYMGTVSLKHIDLEAGYAEFAIVVRKAAMGRGYSREGMKRILYYGIEQLGLKEIYWCVSRANDRAIRFYDKNGYQRTKTVPDCLRAQYDEADMFWYVYC